MGINALTHDANGHDVTPSSTGDWTGWVSATDVRNFVLKNSLNDWLDLYGDGQGFVRDTKLPTYDMRTDFGQFVMAQGQRFQKAVTEFLAGKFPVTMIPQEPGGVREISRARATYDAMREGHPVIAQGVLWHADSKTFGQADYLVRSDVLVKLFPESFLGSDTSHGAPDLELKNAHYVVMDAKFSTLDLLASGELDNSEPNPYYKAQLFIYNRALGAAQGYTPPLAFVLGRGWKKQSGGGSRGDRADERLAPVSMTASLGTLVDAACDWVRRVRTVGGNWHVLPSPSEPGLWPDAKADDNFPWHAATKEIAAAVNDLTMLWQVGPDKRNRAHQQGVVSWKDAACSPSVVGVGGPKQAPKLQAILDVNRATGGSPVSPSKVGGDNGAWRVRRELDFYVDFETVNDLNDDFNSFPVRGGQPLIFMVGCGHLEDDRWEFSCFTADRLNQSSEVAIIDAWVAHMDRTVKRVGAPGYRIFHWSPAEASSLDTSYNSARQRNPGSTWPTLPLYDFLGKVVREEPVVVRGAFTFGLKNFARAMHSNGLIDTSWGDSALDGQGAMVGAWSCEAEAAQTGQKLEDIALMQEIRQYNEIDCKVVMEIVRYLRDHH